MDQLLVARGLAPSRSAAQRLIGQRAVRWRWPGQGDGQWTVVAKAGTEVPVQAEVDLTDADEIRWASRAGLKLNAALNHLQGLPELPWERATVLDVGQSSGGFTDVLLQRGAARVVGVDVGHGQLVDRLRNDPKVVCLEGVNARALSAEELQGHLPTGGFPLIVGDLSFISQRLVWPALRPLLAPQGLMLMLVKPQFELQPRHIGKGGLVREDAPVAALPGQFVEEAAALGLTMLDWFDSAVPGGDGNSEYFILLAHSAAPSP